MEASVEFQVGTGRMPLARQEARALRKPPLYTDEQVRQLAAYIQALGGGPVVPDTVGGQQATPSRRRAEFVRPTAAPTVSENPLTTAA
ncbi:hypothetical protein ACN263_19010 [Micromonospora sp. WMMD729]|uniref:hypothetical protein n=1 Tax=Micromonospora sp. WMMD729 TaxID=3404127 RepID=UPI003BF608F7